MTGTRLLNVKEFAELMGWKPKTVYQKVWLREVEFVKIGGSIRFKPETASNMIEAGTMPVLAAIEASDSATPARQELYVTANNRVGAVLRHTPTCKCLICKPEGK